MFAESIKSVRWQKAIGILLQDVNLILGENAAQDKESVPAVLVQMLRGQVPAEIGICKRHKAPHFIMIRRTIFQC
jgi:hypothetical protein